MFVKICGVTSEEDALLAVAMGADAVGFIFAPSKRQIAPGLAGDIVKRLPPDVMTVGVFRDAAPERVVEVVLRAGLKAAQLHGHESPAVTTWVKERVEYVIKGFPPADPGLADLRPYHADVVLLDSATPGSGTTFDWRAANAVPRSVRLLLAGGLTPANVGAAIEQVRPWGVDVATGVESSPGRKDPIKLRAFVKAAKAAGAAVRGEQGDGDTKPYDWQEEL